MTTFWSWYVSLLTAFTLVALAWILFATRKGERKDAGDQTTGHSYDGIEEYDNPLPKWWFMLFVATFIFAIGYLILYPGMGNWKGLLPGYEYVDADSKTEFKAITEIANGETRNTGWTGARQWEKEMAQADKLYGPIFAKYADMPIEQIAQDEQALKMGSRLFASNCSVCHGTSAKGWYGFPNLTDKEWRWGGAAETIEQTIAHGRTGVMPPQGPVIGGDEGVRNVAAYVYHKLSGRPLDDSIKADVDAGEKIFSSTCFACHGADGKGNPMLGAPNLTNPAAFIYGSDYAELQQTIRYGRSGHMPAQMDFLGKDKVRLLAAYVYSLSNSPKDEQ